jgi:hypothetical protein
MRELAPLCDGHFIEHLATILSAILDIARLHLFALSNDSLKLSTIDYTIQSMQQSANRSE